MPEQHLPKNTDYTTFDGAQLIAALGVDAQRWALAFVQHLRKDTNAYDNEAALQETMIGWFANAICAGIDAVSNGSRVAAAPEEIARFFHDTYEALAPSFGYATRADTKSFDPSTPNGKLMMAVCAKAMEEFGPRAAPAVRSKVVASTEPANTVTRMQDAIDASAAECGPAHAARLRGAWDEMLSLLRGWQGIAGIHLRQKLDRGDEIDRLANFLLVAGLLPQPGEKAIDNAIRVIRGAQMVATHVDNIDTLSDIHRPGADNAAGTARYIEGVVREVREAQAIVAFKAEPGQPERAQWLTPPA